MYARRLHQEDSIIHTSSQRSLELVVCEGSTEVEVKNIPYDGQPVEGKVQSYSCFHGRDIASRIQFSYDAFTTSVTADIRDKGWWESRGVFLKSNW